MPKARKFSPRLLRKLLNYNSHTGELTWKERPAWLFADSALGGRRTSAKIWNTKHANKPALTTYRDGYRIGRIFNCPHISHRVIWALHHGVWRVGEIDHINGKRDDNRISNLREVSSSQNSQNSCKPITNTSGRVGVYWRPRQRKWEALIQVDKVQRYLGCYEKKEDAIAAREAAECEFNFHKNHGRAA